MHNKLLNHRSGQTAASTGQPKACFALGCRLAKRWYDSPRQAEHDDTGLNT
ncbi:hypothetical protein JK628_10745 [Shewanella sp. KX20019]|uniref:hypothetical protein n=1 Tax=Shewanella sp. KX20019 TaxID=2803864 RepID=UPI001927E544|nr:hypothetical protein [Shewanella sp. KX20019]QQX82239.1 hypothetical protein JK628_10745 [Shewanella sp. KX20019]